jgi:hypothetical protein
MNLIIVANCKIKYYSELFITVLCRTLYNQPAWNDIPELYDKSVYLH